MQGSINRRTVITFNRHKDRYDITGFYEREDITKLATCPSCGFSWKTTSNRKYTTCHKCHYSFRLFVQVLSDKCICGEQAVIGRRFCSSHSRRCNENQDYNTIQCIKCKNILIYNINRHIVTCSKCSISFCIDPSRRRTFGTHVKCTSCGYKWFTKCKHGNNVTCPKCAAHRMDIEDITIDRYQGQEMDTERLDRIEQEITKETQRTTRKI